MKALANRLALQHLINAYSQETGRGLLLEPEQQSRQQRQMSQNRPLLWLSLHPLSLTVAVPLSYVSQLGRHRLADHPLVWRDQQWRQLSAVTLVSLLLEDIVHGSGAGLDAASLVERWVQSRDALLLFLQHRTGRLAEVTQLEQDFVHSEQALLLGHAMHPAPKSRQGFVHEDIRRYSPETEGRCQLHFWLVDPSVVAEGDAAGRSTSSMLKQALLAHGSMPTAVQEQLAAHPEWKILPLHPWQARYLMGQAVWQQLHTHEQVVDLGSFGWMLAPSTSVRTLCGDAPWMFKPSLSVSITNSIRVNQYRECLRGEISCRLWHSEFGQQLKRQHPTLRAVNDPAWIAIRLDGQVINETICILRDNPFVAGQQVSCIASLCQDNPALPSNRFSQIIPTLAARTQQAPSEIAALWFERFLQVAVEPMLALYHRYGMAFEAHQQNTLIELDDYWPARFWLRDNQGFYYIEEYAEQILGLFPELAEEAQSVGSCEFVDERFIYYFFGNTLFGVINALGASGFTSEEVLLARLQNFLLEQSQLYPNSSLLQRVLNDPQLPYKGNLMTRLHELDELTAPLAQQSVYLHINNPLQLTTVPHALPIAPCEVTHA
jgi:siderophore synthetase component